MNYSTQPEHVLYTKVFLNFTRTQFLYLIFFSVLLNCFFFIISVFFSLKLSRHNADCEPKLRIVSSAGSRSNCNRHSLPSSTRHSTRENHSLRTVPQSALASKRITRLAALQNRFSAQKSFSGTTSPFTAEKPEPADQLLLSLGLKKVAPAASKPSGSHLGLPIARLRSLAYDMFFVSVPDPQSVSLVHSLLLIGLYQAAPSLVCKDNFFYRCR